MRVNGNGASATCMSSPRSMSAIACWPQGAERGDVCHIGAMARGCVLERRRAGTHLLIATPVPLGDPRLAASPR
jgi:hypothetical protein